MPIYSHIFAWLFITFLCFTLLLNFVNLPGNWIIAGLVTFWTWLYPDSAHPGWFFWAAILGLAIAGEVLENYLQILKGKRAGASRRGMVAGFVGGFIGSILFAPLFFGLGAIFGALFGAWLGCLGIELLSGKAFNEAARAAAGTMSGRLLGSLCKLGTGGAMIFLSAHAILFKG